MYLAEQAKDDAVQYVHNEIGYNYRLPNLNAAFGCAQLHRLKKLIYERKKNHIFYKTSINKIKGLKLLSPKEYSKSNYWMNILIIDKKKIKKTPLYFHKNLLKKKIQTRMIWKPNHLQKMYSSNEKYKIQLSEKIYNSCLCIPSSSNLKKSELKKIIKMIKQIASK